MLKFCVKILFCQELCQSAQDIYGKLEGSGSGSVPLSIGSGSPKNGYLWSSLDERGAQSAPVRHSGQASHRKQRTASGDEDINYL